MPRSGMAELSELARTAGVEVVDTVVQLRDRIDPKFVLGKGKLDDVVIRAIQLDAQTLIFDRNLSPAQASAIAKNTDLKIIDRTQLILDIFAQRAESRDGKLQVELAQLKYSLPRLGQKDDSLSRLTGGIGGRGPGETKLEIGRRRAQASASRHLEAQLKHARQATRSNGAAGAADSTCRWSRSSGYTNAGKSTLLNTLTDADVLAEDKLFATLDTRSRRLRFPERARGGHHRHRGLHPRSAEGPVRCVSRDVRRDGRRRSLAPRRRRRPTRPRPSTSRPPRSSWPSSLSRSSRACSFSTRSTSSRRPKPRLFAGMHPDALFISATNRETTRLSCNRIAELLDDRWAESAQVPAVVLESIEEPIEEQPIHARRYRESDHPRRDAR